MKTKIQVFSDDGTLIHECFVFGVRGGADFRMNPIVIDGLVVKEYQIVFDASRLKDKSPRV